MLIKIGDCWVDPQEIALIRDDEPGADYQPNAGGQMLIQLRHGARIWITATMDEAEAALIDAGVIENPYPEDELEAPDLSEAEREELDALGAQGYEYIARDIDGKLYAYKGEPGREGGYYYAPGATVPEKVTAGDFLFVEPDEAWSISFLLGE